MAKGGNTVFSLPRTLRLTGKSERHPAAKAAGRAHPPLEVQGPGRPGPAARGDISRLGAVCKAHWLARGGPRPPQSGTKRRTARASPAAAPDRACPLARPPRRQVSARPPVPRNARSAQGPPAPRGDAPAPLCLARKVCRKGRRLLWRGSRGHGRGLVESGRQAKAVFLFPGGPPGDAWTSWVTTALCAPDPGRPGQNNRRFCDALSLIVWLRAEGIRATPALTRMLPEKKARGWGGEHLTLKPGPGHP